MRRTFGFFALAVLLWLLGCGRAPPPQYETIQGLQEENSVLRKHVTNVEQDSKHTKDGLQRDHADRVADINDITNRRIAQLEGEIAELRLKLGASERERLALDEIVQSGPRIEEAHASNLVYTLYGLAIVFLVMLVPVSFLLYSYRITHDRLRQLTMQTVADLRIGTEHNHGK